MLVSIIIAGVQKAGTTSLSSYLSEHPRLLSSARKELHFFDDDEMNWTSPNSAPYHANFAADQTKQIAFEATPIYCFWPESMARMHAYNPCMRLILIFRDPIERAWSHWCMEYAREREDLPFAEAIRQGRQRMMAFEPSGRLRRTFSYVERGLYARQVSRALQLFSRRQLLFLRSSDLADEPGRVLHQVAAFLGVEPFPLIRARREGARPEHPYPSELTNGDIRHLRRIYLPEIERFALLTGLRVDDWLTCRAEAGEVAHRGGAGHPGG